MWCSTKKGQFPHTGYLYENIGEHLSRLQHNKDWVGGLPSEVRMLARGYRAKFVHQTLRNQRSLRSRAG